MLEGWQRPAAVPALPPMEPGLAHAPKHINAHRHSGCRPKSGNKAWRGHAARARRRRTTSRTINPSGLQGPQRWQRGGCGHVAGVNAGHCVGSRGVQPRQARRVRFENGLQGLQGVAPGRLKVTHGGHQELFPAPHHLQRRTGARHGEANTAGTAEEGLGQRHDFAHEPHPHNVLPVRADRAPCRSPAAGGLPRPAPKSRVTGVG